MRIRSVAVAAALALAFAGVSCGGEETETPEATPTPVVTPTPEPTPRSYVVEPGDTLTGIAQRFETTVDEIVQANDIADPDLIRPGQELTIPE